MNPLEKENRSLKRTLHVLISKAERNRDVLHTFQEIELRLLSCGNLADLLDMILISLREYFQLDAVNLVLFDPEHAARDLIGEYKPPSGAASLEFTETYAHLRQLYPGKPRTHLGIPSHDTRAFAFPGKPRIMSCALLPLVRQNVIIGSLHLGSNDASRYNKHVATDYINHLSSIVSVCIENCINQETLRRLSIVDMLTKVNNRRAFDQELVREISRSGRNNQPLSCLFVDLDHFKQINDSHGHQTGDRVLSRVAQSIKQKLRQTDFIARYGGEEFAVLLPGCDHDRALAVAESIRQHICGTSFFSEDGVAIPVTLSIGISTCPPQSHDNASLERCARRIVACADKGVYMAKESGRDQVIFVPLSGVEASPEAPEPRSFPLSL
ncbi:sensor domain-containing diguanylate cyclase [Motiliproteus sp. SC1-56]|uniref:sensor domain-containing diguanylate cyclase n=1 Tax=Motiliproteus sp. SC1-56 TaxID=2799565 RepID=UPI001A8D5852|nr:sensor domain-containing diguanylate cyclase [Motiliproteus sp. SC1-56]